MFIHHQAALWHWHESKLTRNDHEINPSLLFEDRTLEIIIYIRGEWINTLVVAFISVYKISPTRPCILLVGNKRHHHAWAISAIMTKWDKNAYIPILYNGWSHIHSQTYVNIHAINICVVCRSTQFHEQIFISIHINAETTLKRRLKLISSNLKLRLPLVVSTSIRLLLKRNTCVSVCLMSKHNKHLTAAVMVPALLLRSPAHSLQCSYCTDTFVANQSCTKYMTCLNMTMY